MEETGLQIWGIAAKILNKWTANKERSFNLSVERRANKFSP
jgi:hypothetical protein